MRRCFHNVLLFSFACFLSAASARSQQPTTSADSSSGFTIKGTVVEHASNRPLSKVLITVITSPKGDRSVYSVSGSDGAFVFNNLPAGKYSLWAQGHGHALQTFLQDEQYSTGIVVGPGLDSEHIVFPLLAPGSISGSVMDQDGDPVGQAQIWLFQKKVSLGKSQILMGGMKATDSSGSFHFAHLAPGTYLIGVKGHPWYADHNPRMVAGSIPIHEEIGPLNRQSSSPPSELDVVYPMTYYADTSDPAAASPVTVAEGSNANIQLTLRAVPALHVRVSGYDATPENRVNPMVKELGPGGQIIFGGGDVTSFSNNESELMGLAPGHYILSLQGVVQGRPENLGTKVVDLTSDTTVDVSNVSRSSIEGHIVFEGTEQAAGQTSITFVELGQGQALQAVVEPSGSFSTKENALIGGRYSIDLANGSGFYLKSIAVKGAKFSGGELDIPDGASVQLSLVAAKGLTHVNGIALKDEKPVPGAMLLLIPQDLNRADLIRRDQSDSDGTFTFNDVAPGRYTAIGIDGGHNLEYAEPSVIKPYLKLGQAVNISGQNDSTLKLDVVSRRP